MTSMTGVFRISEAASLALHTMVLLATEPGRLFPTSEIAGTLRASGAHLAKVLQRLTRAGLVAPVRGPKGGFRIARPPARVTLLDVYQSIEGPLVPSNCLIGTPACDGRHCILGDLLGSINGEVLRHLSGTRLSQVTGAYGTVADDPADKPQASPRTNRKRRQ
jgi:Rrf2 family protein